MIHFNSQFICVHFVFLSERLKNYNDTSEIIEKNTYFGTEILNLSPAVYMKSPDISAPSTEAAASMEET